MLWKYKENKMNELLNNKKKFFKKCDVKENARPLLPSEHSDKKITGVWRTTSNSTLEDSRFEYV